MNLTELFTPKIIAANYPAAKKHNVNMAEFYADLAAAFINDKDASKNKVEKYYECVVE